MLHSWLPRHRHAFPCSSCSCFSVPLLMKGFPVGVKWHRGNNRGTRTAPPQWAPCPSPLTAGNNPKSPFLVTLELLFLPSKPGRGEQSRGEERRPNVFMWDISTPRCVGFIACKTFALATVQRRCVKTFPSLWLMGVRGRTLF